MRLIVAVFGLGENMVLGIFSEILVILYFLFLYCFFFFLSLRRRVLTVPFVEIYGGVALFVE